MDSDGVYKRGNIDKVIKNIKKNNADITESRVQKIAYAMIKELNKKVSVMVADFENGEGDFMACYFDVVDKI